MSIIAVHVAKHLNSPGCYRQHTVPIDGVQRDLTRQSRFCRVGVGGGLPKLQNINNPVQHSIQRFWTGEDMFWIANIV